VLYIFLFLFFTALISSAIIFRGELNSFFKFEVLSGSNKTAVNQKPEIEKVEPYVIETVSTPPKEKDIRTAEVQTETKSEVKEPTVKVEKSSNKKSKPPNSNKAATGTTPAATGTTPAATGTTPAANSNNSSDKNTKNWPRVPPIVEEKSAPINSLPK